MKLRMRETLETHVRTVLGDRWLLYLLWYAEVAVVVAALWALVVGAGIHATLLAIVFLLLCAAALILPFNALRSFLLYTEVPAAQRRTVLEAALVASATATTATLATSHGWAAIVAILLVGNALWALEMDLREARDDAPAADIGFYTAKYAGYVRDFFLRR